MAILTLSIVALVVGWYMVGMAQHRRAQSIKTGQCERLAFLLGHEIGTWEDLERLGVWKMLERATHWVVEKDASVTPQLGTTIAKAAILPILYLRIEKAMGRDDYLTFRTQSDQEHRKVAAVAGSYDSALEQWCDETDYWFEIASEKATKLKAA